VWKRTVSDKAMLVLFAIFGGIWVSVMTMTSSWTPTTAILSTVAAISLVVRVVIRRNHSSV